MSGSPRCINFAFLSYLFLTHCWDFWMNSLSSHKLTKSELNKKYLAEINILTYPLKILVPIPHNTSIVGVVLRKFDGCSQGAASNSWRQSCAAAVQWGKGKAWGQSFAASSSSKLPPLITGHLLKSGHVRFNFSLAPLQPAKNKSVKFFT